MSSWKLKVDNREHKALEILQMPEAVTEQLSLGDFQIVNADGSEAFIIERKTIADLAASVKDGRYKEQKLRLKEHKRISPCTQILYIIEGRLPVDEETVTYGLSSKAMYTFMYNSMFRDGIHVINTQSLLHTCNVITGLFRRVSSATLLVSTVATTSNMQDEYAEALIKSRRKDNVNKNMSFLIQLSSIPGISHSKAKVLAEGLQVASMYDLVTLLKQSSTQDPVKTLTAVNGIGKTIAHSVLEHIGFPKSEST